MDLSVKVEHTKPAKMPSSHHEFFAKLYGSLEDTSVKSSSSSDLNDSKDKDSIGSNDDESKMTSPVPEPMGQENLLAPLKQGE